MGIVEVISVAVICDEPWIAVNVADCHRKSWFSRNGEEVIRLIFT